MQTKNIKVGDKLIWSPQRKNLLNGTSGIKVEVVKVGKYSKRMQPCGWIIVEDERAPRCVVVRTPKDKFLVGMPNSRWRWGEFGVDTDSFTKAEAKKEENWTERIIPSGQLEYVDVWEAARDASVDLRLQDERYRKDEMDLNKASNDALKAAFRAMPIKAIKSTTDLNLMVDYAGRVSLSREHVLANTTAAARKAYNKAEEARVAHYKKGLPSSCRR